MGIVKITGSNVEFAGARNPLIICTHELQEIKADRIYIGGAKENFTSHNLQVPQGAMLYMFSDGYPDQKGGNEGRKYFVTAFKDLLMQLSSLPAAEQKKKLEETFHEWKGKYEQIDDVLVIGIRV
jgi:serine phosphatase RsbU (regulator of sigma subunit)